MTPMTTMFVQLPAVPGEAAKGGRPDTLVNLAEVTEIRWLPEHQEGELQIYSARGIDRVRGEEGRRLWARLQGLALVAQAPPVLHTELQHLRSEVVDLATAATAGTDEELRELLAKFDQRRVAEGSEAEAAARRLWRALHDLRECMIWNMLDADSNFRPATDEARGVLEREARWGQRRSAPGSQAAQTVPTAEPIADRIARGNAPPDGVADPPQAPAQAVA